MAFVIYGAKRVRDVDAALARGEFAPPEGRLLDVLTIAGVLLGLALIAIVSLDT